MQIVNRQKLKQKIDTSEFQIVEVLDPESYESFHLPNAVNVPFDENFADRVQSVAPDKSKPIAVYCLGGQSNLSLKAARVMEQLGYQQVYYYEAGKLDWKNAGMPIETLARTESFKDIHHPL